MHNKKKFEGFRLNHAVAAACIVSSMVLFLLIGAFFYRMYSNRMEAKLVDELEADTDQMNTNLNSWIRGAMQVSDAIYYDVIMDVDYQMHDMTKAFELLYDSYKSDIADIALFDGSGKLVFSAPWAVQKENVDIISQEWFRETITESENIYFYLPHVQNLFENAQGDYIWTLAMCRPVLLTEGTAQTKGVLLISLKYTSLEQVMENTGQDGSIYLTDHDGNIVYHPKKELLSEEERRACREIALSGSGLHREGSRYISVQNIGYTGWIMVNIKESPLFRPEGGRAKAFYLLLAMIFITIVVLINLLTSYFVTSPFRKLQGAVQKIQQGDMDISVEKSEIYEIDRLGEAITRMAARIKELIRNISEEHEKKRKMEMDALQSQINPHFLYNTLDVVVWMIENGKPREAAKAVVALARFFRISLSSGKNIITVSDEIEHVKSYLYIQNLKYKNTFTYHIEMQEETANLSTIKLILQPLVENSICHGIIHIEDESEIWVRTVLGEDELLLIVEDNGWGMTAEKAKKLLDGEIRSAGGHSGIGVNNVNQRIKLYYGSRYGISIESEPDEGTKVTVHLPVVLYEEETHNEKI